MGRKIALVGALLVVAGIAVHLVFVVPPSTAPVTPMDRGLNWLLGLLPMLASVVLMTGAVLLALAVLVAVTGRSPVEGRPTALLVLGAGAWALHVLVETVLVPSTFSGALAGGAMRAGLALMLVSFALQTGAATLLALWTVGVLSPERRPDGAPGRADLLRAEDELRA